MGGNPSGGEGHAPWRFSGLAFSAGFGNGGVGQAAWVTGFDPAQAVATVIIDISPVGDRRHKVTWPRTRQIIQQFQCHAFKTRNFAAGRFFAVAGQFRPERQSRPSRRSLWPLAMRLDANRTRHVQFRLRDAAVFIMSIWRYVANPQKLIWWYDDNNRLKVSVLYFTELFSTAGIPIAGWAGFTFLFHR
jgi:hypothetical protein